MATRAMLRFVGPERGRAQLYIHADGDPESVVPGVAHLREVLRATGTERDQGYAAAQYLYLAKRAGAGTWPAPLLGHAVSDPDAPLDGDEEYLYRIRVGSEAWHARVSEHRGFPVRNAFAEARWQYVGPLPEVAAWAEQLRED